MKQSSELHRDPRTHTGHGGFSAAYAGRLLSDSVVYKSFIVFRVCVHTLVTANYIYICMLLGFIYLEPGATIYLFTSVVRWLYWGLRKMKGLTLTLSQHHLMTCAVQSAFMCYGTLIRQTVDITSACLASPRHTNKTPLVQFARRPSVFSEIRR